MSGKQKIDTPKVGCLVTAAGAFLMLSAVVLFIVHSYSWMKYGIWPSYLTIQLFSDLGLPYPMVSWVGIQKIIDWTMRSYAVTFILFSGVALIMMGGAFSDQD